MKKNNLNYITFIFLYIFLFINLAHALPGDKFDDRWRWIRNYNEYTYNTDIFFDVIPEPDSDKVYYEQIYILDKGVPEDIRGNLIYLDTFEYTKDVSVNLTDKKNNEVYEILKSIYSDKNPVIEDLKNALFIKEGKRYFYYTTHRGYKKFMRSKPIIQRIYSGNLYDYVTTFNSILISKKDGDIIKNIQKEWIKDKILLERMLKLKKINKSELDRFNR